MKDIRIATTQIRSVVGNTKLNLKKMEKFIKDAYHNNVDIICFPELSIQGYTIEKAPELALTVEDESCQFLSGLAYTYNIIILAGLIEKDSGKLFITQVVFYPNGKIAKYQKTHPGETEKKVFSEANIINCFTSSKCQFAIQLCFDCHFPELTTIQALEGAEVIFMPHASPMPLEKRKKSWLKYLAARAYDNSLFIVTSNFTGSNNDGINYHGGCMVFDPLGNVIAETTSSAEEMLIVDLKSKVLDSIRNNKTSLMKNRYYLKSRRPELYRKIQCE